MTKKKTNQAINSNLPKNQKKNPSQKNQNGLQRVTQTKIQINHQ